MWTIFPKYKEQGETCLLNRGDCVQEATDPVQYLVLYTYTEVCAWEKLEKYQASFAKIIFVKGSGHYW